MMGHLMNKNSDRGTPTVITAQLFGQDGGEMLSGVGRGCITTMAIKYSKESDIFRNRWTGHVRGETRHTDVSVLHIGTSTLHFVHPKANPFVYLDYTLGSGNKAEEEPPHPLHGIVSCEEKITAQ